jgi:HAD superfamily hydrolase (TIGR01509 family)
MKTIEVPDYIKGLIFDCDGTLVDSMPLHMKAWEYAITKADCPWDYDLIFAQKGMQGKDIVALYNKTYGSSLDVAAISQIKQAYFLEHYIEVKPIPEVVDVVLRYKNKLPMAVASGGKRKIVDKELDSAGIRDCFRAVVTADDPVQPKPSPKIFLESARLIDVEPGLCQVFEDGDLGLQGAREAGMLGTDVRPYLSKVR